MIKNLFVYSSSQKIPELFKEILYKLDKDKYRIRIYSNDKSEPGKIKNIRYKSGRNIQNLNKFSLKIFSLISVYFRIKFLFKFIWFKLKYKKITFIFIGNKEKLVLSRLASLLGFKVIWLESSEENLWFENKHLKKLFLKAAKKAYLVFFSPYLKNKILTLGIEEKKTKVLIPGIEIGSTKYQDNIFANIAKHDHSQIGKKFFSVGTVLDFSNKESLEILYQSIKKTMGFIAKIQLIVLSLTKIKQEDLAWGKWLAGKMGLDNMVWFISDTPNLLKWFHSLDLFVINSKYYELDNIKTTLQAMHAGLPVALPQGIGFEDVVKNYKNGMLFEHLSSDSLSEKIILVNKNYGLKKTMQANAQKTVGEFFQINKTVAMFEDLV